MYRGVFFLRTRIHVTALRAPLERIFIELLLINFAAGGFSEKQQRVTELSDPALRIAGKPFMTAYAQGVNNTDWGMKHIWKGAPYENTTVDDVSSPSVNSPPLQSTNH